MPRTLEVSMPRTFKVARVVQRVVGVIYVVAGMLKFTPQVEDVPGVLRSVAEHNAGNGLAEVSQLLSDNHFGVQILVAAVMISTGLVYLVDRGFVRVAAVVQIAMLCTFSTFLFTTEGAVILLVDGTFIAINVWLLHYHTRRASSQRGDSHVRRNAA